MIMQQSSEYYGHFLNAFNSGQRQEREPRWGAGSEHRVSRKFLSTFLPVPHMFKTEVSMLVPSLPQREWGDAWAHVCKCVEFLGERYCGDLQVLGICAALQVLGKHGPVSRTPCVSVAHKGIGFPMQDSAWPAGLMDAIPTRKVS